MIEPKLIKPKIIEPKLTEPKMKNRTPEELKPFFKFWGIEEEGEEE